MKHIIVILFFAAALGAQTRATVNQMGGPGTGDPRVLIQQDNGIWVMARIDAETLELVPAATPSQPPVLRAKVPTVTVPAIELWAPPKATTPQQAWTMPTVPRIAFVFRNGVLQREVEDFERVGTLITFRQGVMQSGDLVTVLYQR